MRRKARPAVLGFFLLALCHELADWLSENQRQFSGMPPAVSIKTEVIDLNKFPQRG
ncbi:TPA: hypothetical protein ACOJM5_001224 [Pseudomonas putida]